MQALGEGAVSYERGTPVPVDAQKASQAMHKSTWVAAGHVGSFEETNEPTNVSTNQPRDSRPGKIPGI